MTEARGAEGVGWGFDLDSRQSGTSNRLVTLTVQRPTIYTQVYFCVSAPDVGEERSLCCRF